MFTPWFHEYPSFSGAPRSSAAYGFNETNCLAFKVRFYSNEAKKTLRNF
jgi:hypothetical protein